MARAQEYELDLGQAVDLANNWALDNLDPAVLQQLREVERERVQQFLETYGRTLQDSNVLALATLRSTATNILPILDAYEETAPYAAWLRTRLDYFDVSAELQRTLPKAPPRTEAPPAAAVNIERQVWVRKLDAKPLPPGAEKLVTRLKPCSPPRKSPLN